MVGELFFKIFYCSDRTADVRYPRGKENSSQISTVPAIGAGSLKTSYGKEVPMYSPSSGSYPSPMKAVVFRGLPTGFHKMFAMEIP